MFRKPSLSKTSTDVLLLNEFFILNPDINHVNCNHVKTVFFYITNLTLCYTNQVWKDRAKQNNNNILLNSASNYKPEIY